MRLLLLEDDLGIGDALKSALEISNFNVDWLTDGSVGLAAATNAPYDVIILDLGLPKIDGLDLLKQWRKKSLKTPVLILTARDALPDRVGGLNAGADDYLCKPFAIEEVIARLYALIRRHNGQADNLLNFGQLCLDRNSKIVTLRHKKLSLNKREYLLLELLLTQPQRIFARADIEDKLYNWEQEIESNAVEVHISHLRKKIGKNFIKTWRGMGYQLGEIPQ